MSTGEFKCGLDPIGASWTIWFLRESGPASVWVDVHYNTTNGLQMNHRMSRSGSGQRWEFTLSAEAARLGIERTSVWFTYEKAGSSCVTKPGEGLDNGNIVVPPILGELQGVDAQPVSSALVWLRTSGSWADLHYTVNDGTQMNVRMAQGQGRKEYCVAGLKAEDKISYKFTYEDDQRLARDSKEFQFTYQPLDPRRLLCEAGVLEEKKGLVSIWCQINGGVAVAGVEVRYQFKDADGSVLGGEVRSVMLFRNPRYELSTCVQVPATAQSLLYSISAEGKLCGAFTWMVPGSPIIPPVLPVSLFGPHVRIFDDSLNTDAEIESIMKRDFEMYAWDKNRDTLATRSAQFTTQRFTYLFMPNRQRPCYEVVANIGFYTSVVGLGSTPDDVRFHGALIADNGWNYGDAGNVTQNFWRSIENVQIQPTTGDVTAWPQDQPTNRWAVSQAAPMRRVHITGHIQLGPTSMKDGMGWASGGYMADCQIDRQLRMASQQQFFFMNSSIGGYANGNWNMVFSGVRGAPQSTFGKVWAADKQMTVLPQSPVSAEKPYLVFDAASQNYVIRVPPVCRNGSGPTWQRNGYNNTLQTIPLSRFLIIKEDDEDNKSSQTATIATRINAALTAGKHLLFTPGIYYINETINITQANTVVFGLGYPTLVPVGGIKCVMQVCGDIDGVRLVGLFFDANTQRTETLLGIGSSSAPQKRHDQNPIVLQDIFFRIGANFPEAKAGTCLLVNTHDTVIDHVWAWRADHDKDRTFDYKDWSKVICENGLVVNGDYVTVMGLFAEHFQQYAVLWRGEYGTTIFLQNEMPYDVPSTAEWRTDGVAGGYPAYKVEQKVEHHIGIGLGSYCYFSRHRGYENLDPKFPGDSDVVAARAFEVPKKPGVVLKSLLTVPLRWGRIDNVINDVGGPTHPTPPLDKGVTPTNVVCYENGQLLEAVPANSILARAPFA